LIELVIALAILGAIFAVLGTAMGGMDARERERHSGGLVAVGPRDVVEDLIDRDPSTWGVLNETHVWSDSLASAFRSVPNALASRVPRVEVIVRSGKAAGTATLDTVYLELTSYLVGRGDHLLLDRRP
jgi:hypothetical protein